MDFKTENFAFFLFFLLGKGKANYLSRKVILQKILRFFIAAISSVPCCTIKQ